MPLLDIGEVDRLVCVKAATKNVLTVRSVSFNKISPSASFVIGNPACGWCKWGRAEIEDKMK